MEKTISKTVWFWIGITILFFTFLYLINSILLPFVVGILVAYFLDPAADKLEQWGLSRFSATTVITLVFFSVLALAIVLLAPVIYKQMSDLIVALPGYIADLEKQIHPHWERLTKSLGQEKMAGAQNVLSSFSGAILGMVGNIASNILQSGIAVVNVISLVLITPIVSFYLLQDWDRLRDKLDSLLPRPHAATIRTQLSIIDATIAGFIRGQMTVCLLLGTFYAVCLAAVGLKFGILIGLFSGLLTIIPYIGVVVGLVIGLAVAFFQYDGDLTAMGIVAGVFFVGQFIEGNFVTPKIMSEKIGLHPLWVIFGLLAGGALFGFVGVLIAVPVTAVIGVLIRFGLDHYLQSSLYHGEKKTKK